MTEITAIYGTGVNEITDAIRAKLEQREQLMNDFHRCLKVDLCPKCGDNLIVETSTDDDGDDWGTSYRCIKCHFQYSMA
jgi:hypothetical protein